jgi:hypothetical protein
MPRTISSQRTSHFLDAVGYNGIRLRDFVCIFCANLPPPPTSSRIASGVRANWDVNGAMAGAETFKIPSYS